MIIAVCLDLGTTNIKGALLDSNMNLVRKKTVPAPPITGEGVIQESSPQIYQQLVETVLNFLFEGIDKKTPIGIATQRSSFVLWHRSTGEPVSPLISWQDRRALPWCIKNEPKKELFLQGTGLPFSPHYAGPKLAFLLEQNPTLRTDFQSKNVLFGTLETFLLWQWTRGKTYQTDRTMASRTMMMNLQSGDWDTQKLALFGIEAESLPIISRNSSLEIPLDDGRRVTSLMGDQPAALYATIGEDLDSVLINIGTGGFVTLPTGKNCSFKNGYITAPFILPNKEYGYCMEGTINGLTLTRSRLKDVSCDFDSHSGRSLAYCIPDSNGIGSPHWNPTFSYPCTQNYQFLSDSDKMAVFLEGIIFRVCEILEDFKIIKEKKLILSGGSAQNSFLSQGLASCFGREIIVLKEQENTLVGVGLLASRASLNPLSSERIKSVCPCAEGAYLKEKYFGWKEWVSSEL